MKNILQQSDNLQTSKFLQERSRVCDVKQENTLKITRLVLWHYVSRGCICLKKKRKEYVQFYLLLEPFPVAYATCKERNARTIWTLVFMFIIVNKCYKINLCLCTSSGNITLVQAALELFVVCFLVIDHSSLYASHWKASWLSETYVGI